jgi:GNAT superfamily N-acetyltransferase
MKPLGRNAEGALVAELAAFCVHPAYRGGGKGDSLLEYLGEWCWKLCGWVWVGGRLEVGAQATVLPVPRAPSGTLHAKQATPLWVVLEESWLAAQF